MATTTGSSVSIALTDTKNAPKRVILRLRVNEFEGDGRSWEQHVDAIKAYLVWAGHSASEYEGDFDKRKHFAHVEPFQALEVKQTTFHVILDMEQHLLKSPNLDDVPHEIYRVRRGKEGNL
jgi:hypothetical protein